MRPLFSCARQLFQRNTAIFVALVFLPLAISYWQFKVDDAYISFVYSKNLVQGHGLTYNGMLVEGYSNFLWTVLMAPWIWLGADPLLVARIISLGCAVAALFLTEQICLRLNPNLPAWGRFLALSLVAISTPFTAWTMGGLETMLMAFEVILFVYFELRSDPRSMTWAVLVALLGALTRPEGLMLFGVFLLHRVIQKTQPKRQVLLASLLFIVPFGAYLLWRHAYYGYWLPNTAFLKLDPSLKTILEAFEWQLTYLQSRPFFTVLLFVGLVAILRDRLYRDPDWLLVLGVILAYVLFVLYSGRDWMPHYRFLVPVVLLLSLIVGRAFTLFQRPLARRIGAIVALGAVIFEVILAVWLYIPFSPRFGDFTDGLVRGGNWIRQNTSPTDTIAVVDAGALAYYSERRVIDMIGLNDTHIAHSPTKIDEDYVMDQQPQVIQLHIEVDSARAKVIPPSQVDPTGAQNTDLSVSLYYRDSFQEAYQPYIEGLTDPFFPLFFLKNDASIPIIGSENHP